METIQRISIEECTLHYQVEHAFIMELDRHGLLKLVREENVLYIGYEQLPDLEKYMHLHYDLEINMAGLEAISHLLERVQLLQQEVKNLRANQWVGF